MEAYEIEKTQLGFRLLSINERAEILNISPYKARKLRIEYEEQGLVKRFGKGYYLTEEGLNNLRGDVLATSKREVEESNTGEHKPLDKGRLRC